MEPAVDLLAFACLAAVVCSAIAAPVASSKGTGSLAVAWIIFLIIFGMGLAATQYDGRGTFIMRILVLLVAAGVSLLSLFTAFLGRIHRRRASQTRI
tara:strand:+ start:60 stop:350 length:291 start_codon:yes stop_codon:yes gene_type:complete